MRRREFIAGAVGAAAWPWAASAVQSGKAPLVAVLASAGEEQPRVVVFQKRLEELSSRKSGDIRFVVREVAGNPEIARAVAAEIVGLAPDVILATNTQRVQALKQATRSIPIVFIQVPDPIASGLVQSFARPGGNITGFTNFDPAMATKWLELLKEAAPGTGRVILLLQQDNPTAPLYLDAVHAVAPRVGVEIVPAIARDARTIESSFSKIVGKSDWGMIVPPSALLTLHQSLVMRLLSDRKVPSIFAYEEYAIEGGLLSYGFPQDSSHRLAADYVDRILRGTKPADLPVQSPAVFRLIINLKAAKALGLTVPPTLLARADEVIE